MNFSYRHCTYIFSVSNACCLSRLCELSRGNIRIQFVGEKIVDFEVQRILIDRRWHSSIIDVRSFRGAECDTDHYLVVAKVRERLAVRKQAAQESDDGRFNLRKLNDLEVRKQYQIEITNRFAALENVRTRT